MGPIDAGAGQGALTCPQGVYEPETASPALRLRARSSVPVDHFSDIRTSFSDRGPASYFAFALAFLLLSILPYLKNRQFLNQHDEMLPKATNPFLKAEMKYERLDAC